MRCYVNLYHYECNASGRKDGCKKDDLVCSNLNAGPFLLSQIVPPDGLCATYGMVKRILR